MTSPLSSVLLTGASGFLGGHVLQRLVADDGVRHLVLATRRGALPNLVNGNRCEHIALDLTQALRLPSGIEVVVHIAGEKRDEAQMEVVNHHGTRRLVEAAASMGARRFVYISSVGSYGAAPHSGVVTETFPHTPRNRYEASKDAGEFCVREVCAQAGMAAVILQPSNVIGMVKGKSYPLLGLMKMVRSGFFTWFGRRPPWVNYVAVEDVAAAIVSAASAVPGGDYIINTPAPLGDVVSWITGELGMDQPTRNLPLWMGQAAAVFGSALASVSGRSMPFQRARLLELTNTTRYDPSRLMKAASFSYPVGVEAMIRGLARTYCQEGLL